MGEMKPWQWILVVAAVVVLAVGLWLSLSGPRVQLASQFYMIDLATGEVYSADVSGRRSVFVPAKNPDTGQRSLVPITKSAEGGWMIEEKFRGLASEILDPKQFGTAIDPSTWVVDVDVSDARVYRR